jgi:hypothetical protein
MEENRMKRTLRIVIVMTASALLVSLFAMPALAGNQQTDNMQLVREKIKADKKLFVATNMELTETEAKAFWPVYDEYQEALDKLTDRMLKVIDEYAKNYNSMSDEMAKKLIDDYVAIEGDRIGLMKSYLPKFRAVLSEKKVARYYQLENKINAVVAYEVAGQIPLVK